MRAVVASIACIACMVACGGTDEDESTAPPAPSPDVVAHLDSATVATPRPADTGSGSAAVRIGRDFIPEITVLYRVAACAGTGSDGTGGPLPELLTHGDKDRTDKLQKIVDAHCKALAPAITKFRSEYYDNARTWLVAHEPKQLPTTVVYPFGGGDVEAALVAFPDATDVTTLSLELAGDPRKLESMTPLELESNLAAFRHNAGPMIGADTNLSINLSDEQRYTLAAQLATHLLGMAAGGYELLSVRFFTLDDGGAVHYLEQAEIDADTKNGRSLREGSWKAPKFAQSFANVEIEFRKPGETTTRVFRHIAANLDDYNVKKKPGPLAYLETKGKVAVCVKGAVYLLWQNDFATLRDYLLGHLVWMVSDSTGIPPNFAEPAGMVQEAYGKFEAPLLKQAYGTKGDKAMRKLFAVPTDAIPFQFGYLDGGHHKHLLITKPRPPA